MGIISTVRRALRGGTPLPVLTPPAAQPAPGVPAQKARVGKNGPPLFEGIPQPYSATTLVTYEALDANPQDWFRIMARADQGDTGPMIDMFCDARDRDIHLNGVACKRAQSMMGRPITFRPIDGYENDKEALDIAARVRRLLLFESRSFRSNTQHLMQGAVDGYAVGQLRWTVNREGWHLPHIERAHANRFCFRREDLELSFYSGAYRSHWNAEPLNKYRDSFIVHAPIAGRSDYTWRRGAMRAAIIPSFIKRNGLKFWMTLAERFGMPQPYAVLPEGEDDDGESSDSLVAATKKSLQNLGRIWSMVVSHGIEIKSIPGAGNVNGDVHKELIQWANTAQSIGLLGQNLTTEVSGGSFAAAESHRYVAGDIHLADSVELGETITQQLVEPIVRYNWPGAPVPVMEISTGQKQVFQVEDVREGICSPDERRRTLGHEAQVDGQGADYRPPPKVQVPVQLVAQHMTTSEPDTQPNSEAA